MSEITAEKDKILKKVAKLLKLSNKNPNENEAQSALLFAQRLMAENSIDPADLEGLEATTKEVKKEIGEAAPAWAKNQWFHEEIAYIIAENFRCYFWYRHSNGMTKVVFFGLKVDAELAKTMYEFALVALEWNADQYIEAEREIHYIRDSKPLRKTFMKGFIQGVREKYKAQRDMKIIRIEDGKKVETSVALVLVKDTAVVEAHEKMKFKKGTVKKGGRNYANDSGAFQSGKEKGKAFEAATGYIK